VLTSDVCACERVHVHVQEHVHVHVCVCVCVQELVLDVAPRSEPTLRPTLCEHESPIAHVPHERVALSGEAWH